VAKTKQLGELKSSGNLTQHAVAARVQLKKDSEKRQVSVVKELQLDAMGPKERKPNKQGTTAPPSNKLKKKSNSVQKPKRQKTEKAPQGERKVPVPSDEHGCDHNGLLSLLPLDRKYLMAYVKEGGWLYQTPCYDCASDEDGGDKRVLNVSSLLNMKGGKQLGVYCNCGPVAHKMVQEEEPVRKQLWACKMVLCMDCLNARTKRMPDSGGRRSSRGKSGRC
jgi:hypothetical protein